MKHRMTQKDWENIETVLNMIIADNWDVNSYGERPNFEETLKKVQERLK